MGDRAVTAAGTRSARMRTAMRASDERDVM
jgi:hypothetical protein